MRYRDINHVPVIRDGIPVGIISRHDLLQMMVVEAERGQRTIPRVEGR
jgi:CBS domain-containing protein